ncbi:hypothetical protein DPMN_013198 [Dreissena polymorpha]|uniref:Paraneoplastic antigen Ma-like C-terminal domain-containing protein n=1 Tax=Dreissena polymorpha TaxID=45954 RepID=A0A9D4N779_DREPO|nr:hypothetical protein DPMN_013198 [Dreissena polymorpha]
MEGDITDREKRLRRRGVLRDEVNRIANERELERIKQRDRDIEMKQLSELERQRIEQIEKRRKARHDKDEVNRLKEEEKLRQKQDDDQIRELKERRKALELEVHRMRETGIGIEFENDDEQGACGYEYRSGKRITEYQRDFDIYERNTDRGHTLITVDEYDKLDQLSNRFEGLSMWSNASEDTVDKELKWLDDKALQENCLNKVNSGDRIKMEREKVREHDDYGTRDKDQCDDELEDITNLEEQIVMMKLREMEMVKTIQMKTQLKEMKENERLREERKRIQTLRKQRSELEQSLFDKETIISQFDNEERLREERKRIQTLMKQRSELEQSLFDKETIISQFDNQPTRKQYHHVNKEEAKDSVDNNHKTFMIKPNIPKFSDPNQFNEWKVEIESILESNIYHKEILRQAIRNAISGKPRKVLTTLRPTATSEEILQTLESNYGDIKSGEKIMEEYYNAQQEKDEDISAWGIRLEEIIQKAINRGEIQTCRKERMLKTRFWKHLRNVELKNATRLFFESSITFEELKRKVRREELEMKVNKEPEIKKQIHVQQFDPHIKLLDE